MRLRIRLGKVTIHEEDQDERACFPWDEFDVCELSFSLTTECSRVEHANVHEKYAYHEVTWRSNALMPRKSLAVTES